MSNIFATAVAKKLILREEIVFAHNIHMCVSMFFMFVLLSLWKQ